MKLPFSYVVTADGRLDAEGVQSNFDALANAVSTDRRPVDCGVFTAEFLAGFQATPVAVTCKLPGVPFVVTFSPTGPLLSNGVSYSASAVSTVTSGFTAIATASMSLTGYQDFAWIAFG